MARTHVLILPSWYPTPDNPINGVFFREQAQALAQGGIEVGVVFLRIHSLRQIHKVNTLSLGLKIENDGGVPTYRHHSINCFPRFPRGAMWLVQQVGMRVFKKYVMDNGMPDILHAHSALNGGVLGAHIRSVFQIPLVLTEHASAYARQTLTLQQQERVNDVFSATDRLISVSSQLGELLGKQFPKTSERWEWIPNLVNSSFFDNPRRQENHASHRFVFLNVALMTKNKGQKDLLTAFARGFGGQTDVELWFGGDGPIRGDLEATTYELGITSQVRFMGMLNREQVGKAMRAADAFVLSSHYETFGVVLVEALASGKPVIATRCGGPECIVREEDGILVPVGDIGTLADAMKTMKRDISAYDPNVLRKACRERFGADAIVAQLERVYTHLLDPTQQLGEANEPDDILTQVNQIR